MNSVDENIHDIRLSAEEATTILDTLDGQANEQAEGVRRSKRHPLRGMAMVVTLDDPSRPASSYRVRMRNVSQHGVGFLSSRPMLEGTPLRVHLPLGGSGKTAIKTAVVRRCRYVQGMIYEVGAEFGAAVDPDTKKKHPKTDRLIR